MSELKTSRSIPSWDFFLYVLLIIKLEWYIIGILLPKLFWPTVRKNCSSDLKKISNSWPSASYFKSFSQSQEQFFLTVGQNNFGNKILISLHLQFSIFLRKVLYICMYERNKLFILRWQYAYWNLVAVLLQYAFLSYQIRRVYVSWLDYISNLFKNNCIVFPIKMQTNNLKKWQTIDFDIEYSTNCI